MRWREWQSDAPPRPVLDDREEAPDVADQATEQMSVAAPPERCFDVAADLEHYPEWAADIKEIEIKERDAQGRAQLVTFRAAAFGRSTSYTLAYDYSAAPQVLSWNLTQGDITTKLDGSWTFEPGDDGGTHVTYHLEAELRVPIPGFIKMRAQSRIMSTAMREFKARVESAS
jgi:ribosome-associated toxin RatA of RatAB toxin-antitoxin module